MFSLRLRAANYIHEAERKKVYVSAIVKASLSEIRCGFAEIGVNRDSCFTLKVGEGGSLDGGRNSRS